MGKRMLIDAAHPEETRVVVLSGNRLEEFDFESSTKKQVKGNIYLAKVTRVEPSLQAAFVEYGGNRHGFLAFSEIHPDYYRIPVSDRERAEYDAPPVDQLSELPDGVSGYAPADGSPIEPYETLGEIPGEIPGVIPGKTARESDDSLVEIADALPPAVPVPADSDADDEAEDGAEPAEDAEPPSAIDGLEPEISGDPGDVAMAAPIEAVVSSDPFFESAEAPAAAEEVETLDDDEEAEEAGEQRRRSHSMRHYKIQEVVKRRQIMLVQVAKEERGNKGAALTTYLSLAGRYCVLMPNTGRGGGVSRKITSISDRRRLKEILEDLDIPEGMGVIVRTAGSERSKAEIKRDYEYLMRLWSEIRDLTLQSTAPALIYEEGNLIKRSIRDLYARDIDEVIVEGEEGYKTAKTFMRMLMPSHARRVQPYRDPLVGLFHKYQVESQIDAVHSPVGQLRSGGYIVINQTEALVSVDVNSGRATRERNIEETALKTNLEASDEIARQLRLRDLAGLIVIDYIDMEEHRHNSAVERRLKEALKNDRARIQVGRISAFGLMEMSRQRLRPSLAEASTLPCPHCAGTGFLRSTESTALHVLRSIEEEGAKARSAEVCVYVPTTVALYILNQKRDSLAQIEARYGLRVMVGRDDTLIPPNFRLERLRAYAAGEAPAPRLPPPPVEIEDEDDELDEVEAEAETQTETEARPPRPRRPRRPERAAVNGDALGSEAHPGDREQEPAREGDDERGPRRRRRRRGRRSDEPRERQSEQPAVAAEAGDAVAEEARPANGAAGESESEGDRRRRRRGRRGGRWRNREGGAEQGPMGAEAAEEVVEAAIEGAPIPAFENGHDEHIVPIAVAPAAEMAEELVEAAIEGAAIPPIAAEPLQQFEPEPGLEREPEAEREPERVLEIAVAGNGAAAEPAAAAPSPVDVHAVTEKPDSPRRGWWNRLIQS
jgi:ribonuclease E